MADFRLPDLGEGLTEGEIVAWLVSVGDTVAVDQPVVEVETAKAVVEVPCPYAGVVTARNGEAGEKLAVGSVLLTVDGTAAAEVPESSEYSGNVLIGYGTSDTRRRRGPRRSAVPDAREPGAVGGPGGPGTARATREVDRSRATGVTQGARADQGPGVISPIVRRMARERGVPLERITGTGPGGVIRRADVESASTPKGRRIPLTGLRGAVARKLATSRREIPEATVWVDVDATGLLAARAALPGVSLLALLARFTILGLRRYPELNSRVEGDGIVVLDGIHLGFAAQTERGLVVPVVHDAHTLTTGALAEAITGLAASAREGTLAPAVLTGGTFTLNNYGVFGVDGSAAIINHPEAAILGLGRVIDRPWAVDGRLEVRKVAQLTLAFDHRVCDGGTAGGFLRYVADCVEAPIKALRDL
ncbi:2-oxo acid dehydrogenase subunit E2 [Saccharothrix violaceirubra]|uniref:Dihydrolipoamide acetyltransferase component of pyruvate dehydrogenase complex n=1 Tax=Saccharothrix violaceirubra TaxID=413306 RepID=A0A7W7WV10_9PSEU|nr:dihydrolipoamide acetyltransferase family protein [Saccharothrix violaceirubra]MBB4964820.1 pyruvate dehydrogenase E2 component (dihydrolipoamide acetyltransferase) [Saccharothrix violaceirubra]